MPIENGAKPEIETNAEAAKADTNIDAGANAEKLERAKRRESLKELSRMERGKILISAIQDKSAEVWAYPLVQKFVNHLPVVGDVAMGIKLARGKEGGRNLTGK